MDIKLHCIVEIRAYWVETNLLRSITLNIFTRLLDNEAFIFTWWEEFKGFLGRGWVENSMVPVQVEWMTTVLGAESWKEV